MQLKAEKIIVDIKMDVSSWKTIAEKYAISRTEQLMMEKAFRIS